MKPASALQVSSSVLMPLLEVIIHCTTRFAALPDFSDLLSQQ